MGELAKEVLPINIEDELKMMIDEYPETHESVINLIKRNSRVIPEDEIE